MEKLEIIKNRGILLTIWLGLMLILNAGGAIAYLLQTSILSAIYPYVSVWIFYIYGVLSLANVIFVIFLFMWKRWAFFAICESAVLAFLLNIFIFKLSVGLSLLGLVGPVILYFLLRSKWKFLEKSKHDLLILVSLLIIFIIIFSFSLIKGKQAIPFSELSLEEMAEKVIRENVKEEFLHTDYFYKVLPYSEIITKFQRKEKTGAPLPPFSARTTDLYLTAWVHENIWFTSYIGYDRATGDFIGYDISVRVKEPELRGPELAQKFFKDISSNGWRHGKSLKIKLPTKRELWTIIYKKERNKVYLESEIANYPESSIVYWPEEGLVKNMGLVRMEVLTPLNSGYFEVKQTQKDIMGAYNEE